MRCPDELSLSMLADRELPDERTAQVMRHLETCATCRSHLAALETENAVLMEALRESPELAVSPAGAWSSFWLWTSVAVFALAPLMLDWMLTALPPSIRRLSWIAAWRGTEGLISIARSQLDLLAEGNGMLHSIVGFAATSLGAVLLLSLLAFRRQRFARPGVGVAIVLLLGLTTPTAALAVDLRCEEDGSVGVAQDETVHDTVFLAGKTALVAGEVDGDVIALAERVEVTGRVDGNVYCGGETVTVDGEVTGNIHIVGGNVDVGAKIAGSGYVAGQHVRLVETGEVARGGFFAGESVKLEGRVGRDALFVADTIRIEGHVEGTARGYAGHFALAPAGAIGGDLEVTVPSKDVAEIDQGAAIGGSTEIDVRPLEERSDLASWSFYLGLLARLIALLLFGFVVATLFPLAVPALPDSSLDTLRKMGIGFVALVVTPVAAILVALTLIGIPIAAVVAMLYIILVYLAQLVVAYFAGAKLAGAHRGRVALLTAVSLLAIMALAEVPMIGPGSSFLVHLLGMGCLLVHLKNQYARSRAAT